ncbi:aldehyde dehydrogenase family protein, partial [Nocardia asiatica]|uniref:aldehyde dehydrogenase family protein n=1 Tax=Nocardia asiatica TaxID=209252 RepID=UPI0012FB8E1F
MTSTRGLLINGAEVDAQSGKTTEVRNPHTGTLYATVAAAAPQDVSSAVAAAAAAAPAWAALPPYRRRAILSKAGDLLEQR